jgi:hypothetical protein
MLYCVILCCFCVVFVLCPLSGWQLNITVLRDGVEKKLTVKTALVDGSGTVMDLLVWCVVGVYMQHVFFEPALPILFYFLVLLLCIADTEGFGAVCAPGAPGVERPVPAHDLHCHQATGVSPRSLWYLQPLVLDARCGIGAFPVLDESGGGGGAHNHLAPCVVRDLSLRRSPLSVLPLSPVSPVGARSGSRPECLTATSSCLWP